MKRKILTLLVMMLSLVSFAQKQVYYKVSGKYAYFKVTDPNKSDKYYCKKLSKGKLPHHFEKIVNAIFENQYNEAEGIETPLDITNITNVQTPESQAESNASTTAGTETDYFKPVFILGDSKDFVAKAATDITSHSNLEVGRCYPLLKVVAAENSTLIGCPVICQVMLIRKSNILGSEGRLVISPFAIQKPDGTTVRLQPNDIYRRGLNCTNAKFWLSELIIPLFFPGSGAIIHEGETFDLRIE